MVKPDAPAYVLCVRLATIWHEQGKTAMLAVWQQESQHLKHWEAVAIAETTRVIKDAMREVS